MNIRKVSPKFITGILVTLFSAVALILRVWLPYDKIMTGEWIKFSGADAYYHMRLVDNLVHNFPHLTAFDPYLIFPGGGGVGGIRFFDWLLSGKSKQGPAMALDFPIRNPNGIQNSADFPNLTDALLARGYTESETRKILGENMVRLFKDVWNA